ncbi:RNA exonuclease 4 [Clinocottus analis]|uniref:RNA exonuclease 4 n=1 Tax=Clinocottus analis TaxID=304258 RepID=UPI0035C1FEDC
MSKVKSETKDTSAKTQRPGSSKGNDTSKKKKKQWMTDKYLTIKPRPKTHVKAKDPLSLPPKDALQFSENWKILQEMLKASKPEKKPPVTPQPPNGTLQNQRAVKKSTKNISKNNVCPKLMSASTKVKQKTVPNNAVTKDSQVNSKVPAVTETKPSASAKRKRDSGKLNGEQAAKKKKPVMEEKKPTEADMWFDDVDPDDIEATLGAEAAEIMRSKQGIQKHKDTESALVKERAFEGLTKAVAIDCEMVGVGPDGEESILARVSLVNHFGKCIYDKYVKPTEKVTDYRTAVSGIRPEDIKNGENLQVVQREVAEILQGRIVVGHAIHNDLKILLLDHPKKKVRDTQKYKPFRKAVKSGRPALKVLCREILNVKVQQGEHSSVQDAQATMRLYTMVRKQWEAEIKDSQNNKDSAVKRARKPKSPKAKNVTGL